MAKKQALGGVFDGLFDNPGGGDDESPALITMKLSSIEPNKEQARKHFRQEELEALSDSIREHGVIEALIVRPFGDIWQIVAGERRWRAARMAGLSEVPVRVMELSDIDAEQISLIENLQRVDLNPIEEAAGYQSLVDRFEMTQDLVAKSVSKPRSTVTNALRLLALPGDVQKLVVEDKLSKGHAKVLLGLDDSALTLELANKAVNEGLSVRALERLVKSAKEPPKPTPTRQTPTAYAREAAVHLTERLGRPVKITKGKGNFTLSVIVENEDDLRAFVNDYFEE
ncbi:MAG: ParB/RepB/Spo0J family partition protein [Oscillospiraceae bacterium]|jgi:ParB family chromosome partitioning protein|nr:ParB/RepB/Spo0J family partition protein [Oscillospiraceae bacterium]